MKISKNNSTTSSKHALIDASNHIEEAIHIIGRHVQASDDEESKDILANLSVILLDIDRKLK